jgi:hypothetical protein
MAEDSAALPRVSDRSDIASQDGAGGFGKARNSGAGARIADPPRWLEILRSAIFCGLFFFSSQAYISPSAPRSTGAAARAAQGSMPELCLSDPKNDRSGATSPTPACRGRLRLWGRRAVPQRLIGGANCSALVSGGGGGDEVALPDWQSASLPRGWSRPTARTRSSRARRFAGRASTGAMRPSSASSAGSSTNGRSLRSACAGLSASSYMPI